MRRAKNMDLQFIEQNIKNVLHGTDLKGVGGRKVGKVRDVYIQPDKILLVSTDRHSSFDRIIAHIPFKGQILNLVSNFWFESTKDIVPNHVIVMADPNVLVAKKCKALPVEVVVRGYITGVTSTSLWTAYTKGQRDFGDFSLPEGMHKNQKLEKNILTPTTKSDDHDKNLTAAQIVEQGLLTQELWDQIKATALALFERGQKTAFEKGLILVDTKYEFGLDDAGQLVLIDEIHTPDSSRYWFADTYQARIDAGHEPDYYDKEFLRFWFKEHCDPYKDEVLPTAPNELIAEMSRRYIEIYERLTGKKFEPEELDEAGIISHIENNLKAYAIA